MAAAPIEATGKSVSGVEFVVGRRGRGSCEECQDMARADPPYGGWRRTFQPEMHDGPTGRKGFCRKGGTGLGLTNPLGHWPEGP